jgi:hypothetical protein
MKKIFFSTALVLSGAFFTASAQSTGTTGSGLSFGIRAGVNLQNINGTDYGDDKLKNKLVPRFHAGVNVELPLADQFYLQPGLLFSTKGAEFRNSDIGLNNANLNVSYLEVPLNFLFKPTLGTTKLLLGVGPYVAFGIGGKLTPEGGSASSLEFKNEMNAIETLNGNVYRRLDAGANLLFGFELSSKISAQLNAQLGLAKMNPDVEGANDNNAAYRNTGFGLSVGYRF